MDDATSTVLQTPLAALHERDGAKLGVWFGCALPDDFVDRFAVTRSADWRGEYCFARESVALIDKNHRAYISFTGPDRVRYLNAILTNNIKELATDHGNVSLLLNPQGRILAEMETYAQTDWLFCVSFAMIRERLIEWLDKYIIMDDVTLVDETERYATLALEGPKAADVVRELTSTDLSGMHELASREAVITSIPCRIVNVKRSPGGVAGAEFVTERKHIEALWRVLADAARSHGGGPMGYTALNALRLEQGVPWFGYDFGDKQIPHEAGLQDSHISYTKGCYTGQEIVERVRSRGHVNRLRVGLRFSLDAPPAPNTPLLVEGKEAGYVTRTTFSPALGAAIGMAYVRREHSATGSALSCAEGTATVIAPPLAG